MEAAYQLLGSSAASPRSSYSTYDVRKLLAATTRLRDGEELHIPGPGILRNRLLHRIDTTEIGELLSEFGLIYEKK
ncbi:hypothetical protein ACFVQ3_17415 [Oerskovia sp. NPDC057915]|uniref:hypothetical protein n=1 Tax=Oerskovia sp. NPDC057915 TaxID=3346280 RepID=UPI0036DBA509